MAQTQSRVVELQIKLNGIQNIQELEELTSEINQELKQVAVNSKEFNQLGALAQKANSQLKEVGESIGGITSTEKAEAINKLGQGMVGAFQAAAGASLLFGEKTSEELQKVIAKVGGLFAVTDGLKKVTEAFSAKNVAALKSVVKGWQESAVAAKLFGTTTRAAIAATGIGLIVIAIATVIANFDKLKAAVSKNMDAIKNALKYIAPPIYLAIEAVQYLKEKFGDLQNFLVAVGASINAILTGDWDNIGKAFDDALAKEKEFDKQRVIYNDLVTKGNKELENQNELLAATGDEQDTILKNQKEYNNKLIAQSKLIGDLSKEQQDALDAAIQENKVIDIKLKKLDEESNKKAKEKALEESKKKIQDARLLAEAKRSVIEGELAKTLVEIETAMNKIYADREYKIKEIEKSQTDLSDEYQKQYDIIDETNTLLDAAINNQGLQLKNIEDYINKLDELATKANKINPPTDDAEALVDILTRTTNEYAKQRDLINEANNYIKSYTNENTKEKGIILSISETEMQRLVTLEGEKKLLAESNNIRKSELNSVIAINEENIKTNAYTLDSINAKNGLLESQKALTKSAQAEVEILILNAKNELEKYQLKKELSTLQLKEAEIQKEIYGNYSEQNALIQENVGLRDDIVKYQDESYKLDEGILNLEKQQGKIIAANSEVYLNSWQRVGIQAKKYFNDAGAAISDFLEKWGEQIQAAQDFTAAAFELAAADADAKAAAHQKEIDDYVAANEAKLESDVAMFEARADAQKEIQENLNDEINDLNTELSDAEGERYEDILAEIELKKQMQADAAAAEQAALDAKTKAEEDYNIKIKALEADKAADEKKAAQIRKKQAIVDAIISASLATLGALKAGFPLGLIMAAVYAALGAVQVATISKQPTYAEGGYTKKGGKYEPAGIVHAGEYVVPQRVVNDNQAAPMLAALENMRMKGYADGGIVTANTAPVAAAQQQYIDYKMIGSEVAAALKLNPMFVSVTEFNDVSNRLKVVENRASIGSKK